MNIIYKKMQHNAKPYLPLIYCQIFWRGLGSFLGETMLLSFQINHLQRNEEKKKKKKALLKQSSISPILDWLIATEVFSSKVY